MRKRALAMILCIVICISLVPVTAQATSKRDTSFEETLACDLKALGLFKGVSDTDFDLDRAPSRLEAIIMLIRVLGMEQEALNGGFTHPFTDVPQWADQYVGYAYQNGLTKGMSDTLFGTGTADAGTYLTFVLRSLGYSDADGVDFTWQNPYDLARYIGILPSCVSLTEFLRADVVVISYAALPAIVKGTTRTLAHKLISAQAFSLKDYEAYYDTGAIASHMVVPIELTAEQIYAKCSPAVFYVAVYDYYGNLMNAGSGFFIDSLGTGVTNFHVIDQAQEIKITRSDTGEIYDVLGICDYDEDEDWAILKVDGTGFPFLKQASVSTMVGGATVYAIGSPLGLQNTISQGLISNPKRADESGVTYIQTSAAISPGSSGGALINKYGEVVGITSASYVFGQNLNLALPITYLAGYNRAEPVPLITLFGLPKDVRQTLAYEALRDWVIENASGTVDNYPYYLVDGELIDYELFYNAEYNFIAANMCIDICEGCYQGVIIDLKPSEQEFDGIVVVTDYHNSKEIFYGNVEISAASFSEKTDFKFSYTRGSLEDVKEYQKNITEMFVSTLNFTKDIFAQYIPEYSLSDFGFNGFDG